MAMPLNEGDSATMPVDEEPAPAPAPTISEILAAAVATGGAVDLQTVHGTAVAVATTTAVAAARPSKSELGRRLRRRAHDGVRSDGVNKN